MNNNNNNALAKIELSKIKKKIYIASSLYILIQFISSYIAALLDPTQLGLSAIYIGIYSILFQSAQFEGSYLFLSGELNYRKLILNSRATAYVLTLIHIIISI